MIPHEEAMSEIYGGGLVVGVDAIVWLQSGIGGGLSIERFGASGEPYTFGNVDDAECRISVVPVTLSGMYRVKQKSTPIEPYFGIGGGIYFVSEKIKLTSGGYSASASGSDTAIGFHGLAGMKYNNIIVELKYSSASVDSDGAAGKSANIGGINILAGVRF
jgi:opacity protein-like surface antigen